CCAPSGYIDLAHDRTPLIGNRFWNLVNEQRAYTQARQVCAYYCKNLFVRIVGEAAPWSDLDLYRVVRPLKEHIFPHWIVLHHMRDLQPGYPSAIRQPDSVNIAADHFIQEESGMARFAAWQEAPYIAYAIADHRHCIGMEFGD